MIELKDLVKKFGDLTAVNGINLSVPKGEFFAVLGPNAAGKTTTIKMIAGLIKPTAGSVIVAGYNIRILYPATMTDPAVGLINPAIILIVVVLPAAFGPSTAKNSPFGTDKFIPLTAVKSPNFFTRSFNSIIRNNRLSHSYKLFK